MLKVWRGLAESAKVMPQSLAIAANTGVRRGSVEFQPAGALTGVVHPCSPKRFQQCFPDAACVPTCFRSFQARFAGIHAQHLFKVNAVTERLYFYILL